MRQPPYSRLLGALACLTLFVGIAGCKSKIAGGKADGEKIYAEVCAKCHGAGGMPTGAMKRNLKVKDLTDPALHKRLTDSEIRKQIRNGSANRLMPGFGSQLSEDQMAAIVKYVRGLRRE